MIEPDPESRPRTRHNAILHAAMEARGQNRGMTDVQPSALSSYRSNRAESSPSFRTRQTQQAIQERIKNFILEEGLRPGDPMPTEAELVEGLGVARNSLREALKALQALGIIEIRHGFGTYVGDCSLDPFADALVFRGRRSLRTDWHELREIVDLRQALEVGLISQVVQSIDDDSVARLGERLAELEKRAGQGEDGDAADRAFHDELYATMGNQLMSQLLRVFWDVYHDLAKELPPVIESTDEIVRVHREIYQAVADRDGSRASIAVAEHFRGIQQRLDGSPG